MARAASAIDAFHAIADGNRRALLDAMTGGKLAVGDLVTEVGLSYSAVSQHLAILHDAGLVHRREQGRQRIYSLNASPIREVHTWTSSYERFWRGKLARLHRVLDEEK